MSLEELFEENLQNAKTVVSKINNYRRPQRTQPRIYHGVAAKKNHANAWIATGITAAIVSIFGFFAYDKMNTFQHKEIAIEYQVRATDKKDEGTNKTLETTINAGGLDEPSNNSPTEEAERPKLEENKETPSTYTNNNGKDATPPEGAGQNEAEAPKTEMKYNSTVSPPPRQNEMQPRQSPPPYNGTAASRAEINVEVRSNGVVTYSNHLVRESKKEANNQNYGGSASPPRQYNRDLEKERLAYFQQQFDTIKELYRRGETRRADALMNKLEGELERRKR